MHQIYCKELRMKKKNMITQFSFSELRNGNVICETCLTCLFEPRVLFMYTLVCKLLWTQTDL